MIEKILPAGVAVAETFHDLPGTPFPEEEAAIARAVGGRRREFITVRACARRALADLSLPPAPLPPGAFGAPAWPDRAVGSMTHCDGYRAAAVAHRSDVRTIGIDAEPHAPLPEGVFDMIAVPGEHVRHAALRGAEPEIHWDRLLLSAKESVYKAWSPLTGLWLGFAEADIVLFPDGLFSVRYLARKRPPGGRPVPAGFSGRWLVTDGLVITSVTDVLD
ncbi:4'-phosphopantetheinyl transferase superfamily protein [Actinomadura sp. 6K520]|uniref:4'-phosphopantetheinyl transferase family protein n=1 Tax=Actinomadura sp. 6K520 TaxID=2530364 RepID=UPI00104EAE48|nr:4'-phosphopantetheinyl transferase superfamily protein [Actinomadura sp. 6K520]TDE29025.1 4'-phosphopantetheinyl transferase superfamily protein [Actinomadura sp. 6K520]